jgi:hypothetical protein
VDYLHQARARDGGFDGPLGTTRSELSRALGLLRSGGVTTQDECETYTWSVLREAERPTDDAALARGIAREVASARDTLS